MGTSETLALARVFCFWILTCVEYLYGHERDARASKGGCKIYIFDGLAS